MTINISKKHHKDYDEIWRTPNYKDKDGKICLVRCPKCYEENYALSVNSGICAWCGFDANAEKVKDG